MLSHVTGRVPVHPDDAVRPSTTGSNEHGGSSPRPASTTPSAGFPSTPSSGKPSGLLSTLHNPPIEPKAVSLRGDATTYYVKNPSDTNTPQSLYTRDPDTGVLKQTSKQVVSDGTGGWKLDKGLVGGGQASSTQSSSSAAPSSSRHDVQRSPLSNKESQEKINQAQREFDGAEKVYQDKVAVHKRAEQELKYLESQRYSNSKLMAAMSEASRMPGGLEGPAGQRYMGNRYHQWEQLGRYAHGQTLPGKELKPAQDAVHNAKRDVAAAKKAMDKAERNLQYVKVLYSNSVQGSGHR